MAKTREISRVAVRGDRILRWIEEEEEWWEGYLAYTGLPETRSREEVTGALNALKSFRDRVIAGLEGVSNAGPRTG
jgi:hypothetical protein